MKETKINERIVHIKLYLIDHYHNPIVTNPTVFHWRIRKNLIVMQLEQSVRVIVQICFYYLQIFL